MNHRNKYLFVVVFASLAMLLFTADAAHAESAQLTVRYEDQILFNESVQFVSSTYHDDVNNADYPLDEFNVFSLLALADAQSDAFDITDGQFNAGFQSFYVACIFAAASNKNACNNWRYVVNGAYTMQGMDQYALSGDENIYIYFGDRFALTVSTTTILEGENAGALLQEYDYTTNTWMPGQGDLVMTEAIAPDFSNFPPAVIATVPLDAAGNTTFTIETAGNYLITVPEEFFPNVAITVNAAPADEENDNNDGNGGGDSDGQQTPVSQSVSDADIQEAVTRILGFFQQEQNADGSMFDGGTTDWIMMSFGANAQYADDIATESGASLLDFSKTYSLNDPAELNLCASYPRHLLALLSSGVAADSASTTALATFIQGPDCYEDGLYGQMGINDDIFALMALLAAGVQPNAAIVGDITETVLADQTPDGAFTWVGFASSDITGGAINALSYAKSKGVAVGDEVFTNAKNYLKSQQLLDGGWGFGTSDALNTSWALMGVNALGEGQEDWTTASGTNPWTVLVETLSPEGYYQVDFGTGPMIDLFGTKHAAPALLGKSWPIILAPQQEAPTENEEEREEERNDAAPDRNSNGNDNGGFNPGSTPSDRAPGADIVPEALPLVIPQQQEEEDNTKQIIVESDSAEKTLTLTDEDAGTLFRVLRNGRSIEIDIAQGSVEGETTFRAKEGTFGSEGTPVNTDALDIITQHIFIIEATNAAGNPVTTFQEPLIITFTLPELPESDEELAVYYFDEKNEQWVLVPKCVFEETTITCTIDHLTKFSIFRTKKQQPPLPSSSSSVETPAPSISTPPTPVSQSARTPIQAVAGIRVSGSSTVEILEQEAPGTTTATETSPPVIEETVSTTAPSLTSNDETKRKKIAAAVFGLSLVFILLILIRTAWQAKK